MNCSPLPCEITIKKNIMAQNIPKTQEGIFKETSFMEVFRINQWHKNKMPTTTITFKISNCSNIFSPSPLNSSMDFIMFQAVLNSLALKKTQVILTQVNVINAKKIPLAAVILNGKYLL